MYNLTLHVFLPNCALVSDLSHFLYSTCYVAVALVRVGCYCCNALLHEIHMLSGTRNAKSVTWVSV